MKLIKIDEIIDKDLKDKGKENTNIKVENEIVGFYTYKQLGNLGKELKVDAVLVVKVDFSYRKIKTKRNFKEVEEYIPLLAFNFLMIDKLGNEVFSHKIKVNRKDNYLSAKVSESSRFVFFQISEDNKQRYVYLNKQKELKEKYKEIFKRNMEVLFNNF